MPDNWILLIDPYKNLLNAYRMILEVERYVVETASSLENAYELLRKREYAVVITDYIPPFEATDEMIQWIKKTVPETFIIIVSDVAIDEKTYERLFESGADDFLLKPYSPERVLVHIKMGLKQRGLILRMRELEKLGLFEPVSSEVQRPIFNPTFFKRCLRQEIKRTKRHHRPLSLLLVQMPGEKELGDHFRGFYGEFVKLVIKNTREEDMVGKHNGEIGLILPETDRDGSRALIQRLVHLLQGHPQFKSDGALWPHLDTLSFQSFTYPDQFAIPESLSSVLEEADKESLSQ